MIPEKQLPDDQDAGVRPENLLLRIWVQPQATLRYILAHCPTKHVTLLMLLGGIARMLGRIDPGHPLPSSALPVAVVVGSFSGWIFYYIYARGLLLAGKLLHGPANFAVFETIVAWSLVPISASIPLSLLLLDTELQGQIQYQLVVLPVSWSACVLLVRMAQLALAAWSLTILFTGVRLVQGFGIGRALLNMLLPGGLLLLLIGIVLVLQKALEAASQ